MLKNLEIFRLAQGMANHAAIRQSVIAQNIANADTPGYRAQDISAFSDSYKSSGQSAVTMRRSRPGHFLSGEGSTSVSTQQWTPRAAARPGALSPNGNNVSLESELMMAAQVKGEQDRALAIYRSALTILRTSLGRG